jgi:TfoX/Sxy family transcriptional regulator of competence genes
VVRVVVARRRGRCTSCDRAVVGAGLLTAEEPSNPVDDTHRQRLRQYDRGVAYDEKLAERIRELIGTEPDLTEKKMFGGLSFLIGGNMAVAASGQGGILVRVDPDESDRLVGTTDAHLMEMRGRSMRGWLRVDAEHVRTKRELAKWVERGTSYARSLPAK